MYTTYWCERLTNTYVDLFQYTYIPRESEKMAKVDVVWNNNFYIDDENDVQGKLYKYAIPLMFCPPPPKKKMASKEGHM